VAAINSIGDFVLFLAKAGTVAIVAVVGIEMFRVSGGDDDEDDNDDDVDE
jgi:hypothetical protein